MSELQDHHDELLDRMPRAFGIDDRDDFDVDDGEEMWPDFEPLAAVIAKAETDDYPEMFLRVS